MFLLITGVASTEPAAIEQQRSELAQLQAELDRINGEVGAAAEAYNGARYELEQVRGRITQNTKDIKVTKRDLARMQTILNERLVRIYTTREPSLAEALVTSGSISEAADKIELIQRVGAHDARVVRSLHRNRERLAELRAQLVKDRKAAAEHVARRAAEKERIEGLLAEQQRLVSSADSRLQRLLAEERERQRREAEEQARLARQRAAAQAAQERSAQSAGSTSSGSTSSSGGSSEPASSGGSGSSEPAAASEPSAPLPSGSGNAAAASVAMQYLGVPYRWGGEDPSGFDCSGLATYAYRQIGKSVPHYTVAAYNAFPKVPLGSLQAGDLVFFNGLNHMGIYIGGGQYVHAPQTGDVVKVSPLSSRGDIVGAVRP